MRNVPFRRGGLLAALLVSALASAPLAAQDSTQSQPAPGGTHTVKKGDTLWDIAHQYLNDPFLWPEIYRINTDVVEDPHWIYPNEVLKLPANMVATTPNGTEVTTVVDDRMSPMPTTSLVEAPRSSGSTVFSLSATRRVATVSRFGASATAYPHPAVRVGEVFAAPWLDRANGPSDQGTIVGSAEISGIATTTPRTRMLNEERAYITLPKDVVPARGDRYLAFQLGPVLEDGSQMVEPTGVVEVERAENGDASTVRIITQYSNVEAGQGIIPIDHFTLGNEARPSPLMLGTEGKVVFVSDGAVLPTMQGYVVIDVTAKDGAKIGDQYTLYVPRRPVLVKGRGDQMANVPEERVALAQVVKVTDRGTTLILVDQQNPAVKVGMKARLTARMP
ncbi:MAG TPA: LysM peptidoglycan-binding domain-containing protein [Gemmatimonadaceae bacterium]|nr:LysM peptidoglycan-binding domain-containing protein [Gemmatimonadaceae bacterium]